MKRGSKKPVKIDKQPTAEKAGQRTAPTPSRPTIRDVARLARVSRMTVSRVVNTPDLVIPETRSRVLKSIEHLGYLPDRAAGGLANRRTGLIGLILPTLTNANFASVAHGLTEVLRTVNYHLLVAYTDYNLEEEERQISNVLSRRPEALVLTGGMHSRNCAGMLLRAGIPIIEIADAPTQPMGHSIGFSNYDVGQQAARHLIGLGFEQIGAVGPIGTGNARDFRGEERINGFADELRTAGLSQKLILRQGVPPISFAHGAKAFAALISAHPSLEAVFAVSDLSAVGVMMECQRQKIDIPGKLSLIGFGDFEIATETVPRLTTIRVDFRALGVRTGTLIVDILAGNAGSLPQVIDVGFQLLERETTHGSMVGSKKR